MVSSNIFKVFGRSPIKPLQKHMQISLQCAERLIDFFTVSQKDDWQQAAQIQQTIVSLENDADTIKRDIRAHLPKTLFMPIPREDVLEILTMQDKLPNRVKDIAGLVLGRKLKFPEAVESIFMQLLNRAIDCARKIDLAIHEIDELLETSFSANEISLIENIISEVSDIEHQTDNLQIDARATLYQIERQLCSIDSMPMYKIIDVFFLYKILEQTSEIADRAEQIGERLQVLIAK